MFSDKENGVSVRDLFQMFIFVSSFKDVMEGQIQ